MVIGALLLVVFAWSAYTDRVNDPCRGLSPLACQEAARASVGPLVSPDGTPGLTQDELRALADWGRLTGDIRPWHPAHVHGVRVVPEPLP